MELLNLIGKEIDLTVYLLDLKNEKRGSEWYSYKKDNSYKLKIINNDFYKDIKKEIDNYDILINSIYATKHGIYALNLFKKHNKTCLLQADGGIPKDRGFIVNNLMSYVMKKFDYYLSSSEITDEYFIYYGVDKDKIRHYRFSSLTEKDIDNNRRMSLEKEKYKKELNIKNKAILSVGQPIHRKGFDILVKVFERLKREDNYLSLYIVGGNGPKEVIDYIEANRIKDIHFVESIPKNELSKYYAASDVFVLCTREDIWGLVINEALSFGLPVITSKYCVAGRHFNNKYGVVDICDNSVDEYVSFVKERLNFNLQNKDAAYKSIKDYTIENNAKDIIEIINKIYD